MGKDGRGTEGAIIVDRTGGMMRLTIDRPAKANALTGAMLRQMQWILSRIDAELRVLVITGSGPVFCAGADLTEAADGLATSPVWEEISGAVAALRCLTIAAVNGPCAGGATGMLVACDLRIAVPSARFFYPVARLGFLPPPSDPRRLTALIGPARARLILLGGARIEAAEALAMGLVDRVTDDLDAEIDALSAAALAAPRGHIAAINALIR